MTYNDITYCSRECANMECKRNQKHLPKGAKIVSMAEFTDCRSYNREKMLSEADEMFERLGYEKKDERNFITYINRSIYSKIIFYKDKKTFYCEDNFGDSEAVTMAELKAINKKCQELGWK